VPKERDLSERQIKAQINSGYLIYLNAQEDRKNVGNVTIGENYQLRIFIHMSGV
jgi:hypothetical protein